MEPKTVLNQLKQNDPVPNENVVFYYVFNPEGSKPTVKHPNYLKALDEAKRLAMLHPGHTFLVLKAIEKITTEVKIKSTALHKVD